MSLGTMIYVFMIIIVRREIRRFRHRSKWKSRSMKIFGSCLVYVYRPSPLSLPRPANNN